MKSSVPLSVWKYFTLGTMNGDRVSKDEMGCCICAMRFFTKNQQYWGPTDVWATDQPWQGNPPTHDQTNSSFYVVQLSIYCKVILAIGTDTRIRWLKRCSTAHEHERAYRGVIEIEIPSTVSAHLLDLFSGVQTMAVETSRRLRTNKVRMYWRSVNNAQNINPRLAVIDTLLHLIGSKRFIFVMPSIRWQIHDTSCDGLMNIANTSSLLQEWRGSRGDAVLANLVVHESRIMTRW